MHTAPIVCAGPCGRAYRAAEAAGEDTTDLHVFYGDPYWCWRCAERVAAALTGLPQLLGDIREDAVEATAAPGERVRHTSTHATAPGEAATTLHDMIVTELLWFEDQMRVLRRWSPRVDGPDAADISRRRSANVQAAAAIKTLSGSLDWLLAGHPDAADPDRSPGAQILALHRAAERFTCRDRPRTVIRDLPCPGCGLKTLTRRPGEDRIDCGNPECLRTVTEAEYRDWGKNTSPITPDSLEAPDHIRAV